MTTCAEAALNYHTKRKWKSVPFSRKTKKPIGREWQKRPFNPNQFNGNDQNVGIQFGEVSGGLVDVDLDSKDAIGFAPEFLPPTDAIFGRRSKPCSVGAATVVPPSMHETGEMVEWVRDGAPGRIADDALNRAVLKNAIAALLKPDYPGQGSRHEGALVIGGVLARAGWHTNDIGHVVMAVARAVGDNDVPDRVTTATGAVNLKANGRAVPGFDRLRKIWGDAVADTLKHWLKLHDPRTDKGVDLEDRVALAFATQHTDHFRYIAESNQWMRWGDFYWKAEKTLFAFDESRKLCRGAGDARARTVAAVTTLARADRRMAAVTDQWDCDPKTFNTPTKEST